MMQVVNVEHLVVGCLSLVAAAVLAQPYAFTISCDEPTRARTCGETTEFRIECKDLAKTNDFGGTVEVWLDNWGDAITGRRTVDPAKENPIVLKGTLDRPGFLRAVARNPSIAETLFSLGDGNACDSVAYEPEKVRQGVARPADFDAYWDGEIARLAREVPLDARREPVADYKKKDFVCWKVSFATFGGKRVWGFLTEPADRSKAPWPLRVNVPGAGPAAIADTAMTQTDAVCLTLNVHPYEPSATMAGQKRLYAEQDKALSKRYGVTYAPSGVGVSREEGFFHDPIVGMNRAVDWAAQLPEVDRSRVWYLGGSQGGGFGTFLMGLNRNFTRGYIWICALADHGGHHVGRIPGWPRMVTCNKQNPEAAERNAPYFDACNFAARIRIPVRMMAGLADCCCPPPTVYSVYNALGSSDKAIVACPGTGHHIPQKVKAELDDWLTHPSTLGIARAELARYWKAIIGADEAPVELRIDTTVSASGNDAYSITSTSAGARITGSNARSVLYGVYDLLERRGGCGWFWDGDRVPKKKAIDLTGLDVREESKFAYRGLRYFAHRGLTRFQAEHWGFDDWKREIDWLCKKRLNLLMLRIGQDDFFQKAFPEYCPYPDAAKPLPGQGDRYDNRSLFWPLEFRGKLRKQVMDYAFARGLMAPEDFGTMTHWYSRTPQDFLDKAKPDFLPQAEGAYGEPSGLVWDIRQPKWLDAYWKLTETSVREYGRSDLLHTIGVAERRMSTNRLENLQRKIEWTNMLLDGAKRRYPDAVRLLAGWDLYCMKDPQEVKNFLKHIPEDVIIWDYEADASINTWFGEWDIVGRRPYVFGVFMAYEAGLDPRTDYAKLAARQKLVENDPMCKGYILWPESSHVDSMGIEWYARNAWRADQGDIGPVVDAYCRARYPDEADVMAGLWKKTIAVSTNNQFVWRWNAYLPIMRELHEGIFNPQTRDRWPRAKPDAAFAALPDVVATLKKLDWKKDELLQRDMIDLARVWADRLAIEAENRCFNAWFDWVAGDKASAAQVRALVPVVTARLKALADVLDQHTDFSVCDALDRLNAVHPVTNPGFGRVLVDNACNNYCASHQAELARTCYIPAFEAFAAELLRKLDAGDRTPPDREIVRAFRTRALETPIDAIRSKTPRTGKNFSAALSRVLEASIPTPERPVYNEAASRETVATLVKEMAKRTVGANTVTLENLEYYPADARLDAPGRTKCRMDFRYPEGVKGFRTLVWLHSGGLDHGARHWVAMADTNIAQIAVSYRLMGQQAKRGEDCIEDAAAAVAWALKNVAAYGGDPQRVYVAGHSAGAYLSMMVGMDPRWLAKWGCRPTDLAGIVPISGQTSAHFNIRKYAGDADPQFQPKVDALSPLHYVGKNLPPILSICGQPPWEWEARAEENRFLIASCKAMGHRNARYVELPYANHHRACSCGLPYLELFIRDALPPDPEAK